MSVLVDTAPDVHETGEHAVAGSLACTDCGYSLALGSLDRLPRCPACGGSRFRRARMFEQPTMDGDAIATADVRPEWLEETRRESVGPCIAYEERGERVVVTLDDGWTRIGRSGSADVRLDDPTVSRRHALVVRTPDAGLRALDDRSLNGLFVNGERVDWAPLEDGDELEIGRYRLYVLVD
jgi:predicted  nucleic acid-binding Zn-ribbon protein